MPYSRALSVMLTLNCVVYSQGVQLKRQQGTRTAHVQLQNDQQDWFWLWGRQCAADHSHCTRFPDLHCTFTREYPDAFFEDMKYCQTTCHAQFGCKLAKCSVRNGTSLSSAYPCKCGSVTCESDQVCAEATSKERPWQDIPWKALSPWGKQASSCETTCEGYSCPFGWVSYEGQSAIIGKGRTDQACCQSPCLKAKKSTGAFNPEDNYGSWKTTELTLRSDGAAFLFDTDAGQGPDGDYRGTQEYGEYSRFEGSWSSSSNGSYSVILKTKHFTKTAGGRVWESDESWTKAFSPPAMVTVVSDGSKAEVSDGDQGLGLSFTAVDISLSRNCVV